MNGIKVAINFAVKRHAGQTRPGGEPQISHLIRVGTALAGYAKEKGMKKEFSILVVAGLLHDVLEDTETTDEGLRQEFGVEVARIVRALSHEEEEEPDEVYLHRVAQAGKLAILVKRFDRLDNLRTLANTSEDFRARKLAEVRDALPIWREIDPEGARQIEEELEELENKKKRR